MTPYAVSTAAYLQLRLFQLQLFRRILCIPVNLVNLLHSHHLALRLTSCNLRIETKWATASSDFWQKFANSQLNSAVLNKFRKNTQQLTNKAIKK